MSPVRVPLRPCPLTGEIARLIRDTRVTIGWSQDELADRAHTSQTKIWRMERDRSGACDLETLDRVLRELGLAVTLEIEGRHLEQRVEQRDVVHAALLGELAARIRRAGWLAATEVPTGAGAPTGWIDLLAYREADAALLVTEVKAAVPDVGGLQRQVAFYEREAAWAALRQGWQPSVVVSVVACLDSVEVSGILAANRALLRPEFAGDPVRLEAWIRSPSAPLPARRTAAAIDLASRRLPGLRRTPLSGRRSVPAYRDYADAARALRRRGTRRCGRPSG
jgi:transcriptional regulator with XRE-family HTH domain